MTEHDVIYLVALDGRPQEAHRTIAGAKAAAEENGGAARGVTVIPCALYDD